MKNKQRGASKVYLIILGLIVVVGLGMYIFGESNKKPIVDNSELSKIDDLVGTSTSNGGSTLVTVLSPNGGETYKKGDTVDIKWNATNIGSSTLEIDLFRDNGSFVYDLQSLVNPLLGTGINAPATWFVPTDGAPGGRAIEPGKYKVRVCLSGGVSVCDISDTYFTVTE